jgi:hypothetical protein
MNYSEFQTAWKKSEQNLQPIAPDTLKRFNLNKETINFLSESGLPTNASPFLSFVGDACANKKYSTINLLTDRFGFLEAEFRKYVVIGFYGHGDIIAINTENNCTIEWLNHEDYFSSRFMNSSVGQLANSVLCYRDFVKMVNNGKKINRHSKTVFTETHFDVLHDILKSIDERAVQEGFWKQELDILLKNREYFRNKNYFFHRLLLAFAGILPDLCAQLSEQADTLAAMA